MALSRTGSLNSSTRQSQRTVSGVTSLAGNRYVPRQRPRWSRRVKTRSSARGDDSSIMPRLCVMARESIDAIPG